jgi:uncharacterized protein
VGPPETKTVPELIGYLWCILGTLSTVYLARRARVPNRVAYSAALAIAAASVLIHDKNVPWLWPNHFASGVRAWVGSLIEIWWLWAMAGSVLVFLFARKRPTADTGRRRFLRTSTAALCAGVPAVALSAGIITRKDFRINEVDISFPNLPKDLQGLRLLQISDIHMGPFFSANDLRRVIDASNSLRPDLAFITGDLITTPEDPLDHCIAELKGLRSASGVWGCMGNHELYAKVEQYTKLKAAEYGIDFLREEARTLRFGESRLNLVGVDFRPWQKLSEADGLLEPGQFNVLLAHTPEIFQDAAKKGFDLTLSGHTHGGQINLDVLGTNFNIVDLHTPYTKGLYHLPGSVIYVNSGLGTIGLPIRIGAPPEITLIRLCKS